MLISTPIGLLRWDPKHWLQVAWLWLTAPKECRESVWSIVEGRAMQIRSLSDGELWVMGRKPVSASASMPGVRVECRRRNFGEIPPAWLRAAAQVYPDGPRMRIAEKIFRPAA